MLKEIMNKLDLAPSQEEFKILEDREKEITKVLKDEIKRNRIKADVFTGGSFAKKTMLKSDNYDVDILVRFQKGENLSDMLEKIIKKINYSANRVHGSRDYFRLTINKNVTFEIIPVRKIVKPKDSENVTDLTYFHVSYVKKRLNAGITNEIRLFKAFLKANKLYGAESYIQGISGYGVECLMLYYKTFDKLARAIVKANDRIFIDMEKHYKNRESAFLELNENKLSSIVLVDPTWKERNVLAALSKESFEKLKLKLVEYLKNPSKRFFEIKEFNENSFAKSLSSKMQAVKIMLSTSKQAGDIAGTKMKKFSNFLVKDIGMYFDIMRVNFEYSGENTSIIYLAVKPKEKVLRKGPPMDMKDNIKQFKKINKKTFVKNGNIFAEIKFEKSVDKFLENWKNKNKNTIKEMDISNFQINLL